jgi:phage gpG-like protein
MPWDTRDADDKDARLAAAVDDTSPAMREIASTLAGAIDQNFAEEGSAGVPWQPLAESTKEERRRLGYGDGPILQRTGGLRKAAAGVKTHTHDSAEVGLEPDHPYGKYHLGDGEGRLPRRDFLELSSSLLDDIDDAVIEHLERHGG